MIFHNELERLALIGVAVAGYNLATQTLDIPR